VSTWFDASFNHDGSELTDEEWARHWQRCVQEASEAGVLLLFAQADERHTGALVELGSALASGAQVYLVAPHANWSVRHHPRCRSFDTPAWDVLATVLTLALRLDLHADLGHQGKIFALLTPSAFTFSGAATQPLALKLALATRTRDVPSHFAWSHWGRWQITGATSRHHPPGGRFEWVNQLLFATTSVVSVAAFVATETAGIVTARSLVGV
jgi:hypothetical protein